MALYKTQGIPEVGGALSLLDQLFDGPCFRFF